MEPRERLEIILRPAGGGVYVVSTGLAAQQALQQALYGAPDAQGIQAAWGRALDRLGSARVVVLGVPSDNGAGFTRGANQAPAALRAALLAQPDHPLRAADVVDVGDVRVIPHLLSEGMLSAPQIAASRAALYGDAATALPVSPLALTTLALDALATLAPQAVPVVLGGDHSVGWPAFEAAWRRHERDGGRRLGLLHFDAHTDLLPHRLGVDYCFATWAYHANELLGRDGRLVQVGIRASGHDRAHWEAQLNVRQYWPDGLAGRSVDAVADEIAAHFEALGVDALYVSNDIDGTDPAWAAATGTPAPGGLTPTLVSGLTRRLAARFPLVGADLVEVAPPLAGEVPGEPARTLRTALGYLADFGDLAGVSRPGSSG